MSDKCPFCGRGRDPGDPRGISYECGTLDNDPLPRAFQCMRDWACNLQAGNEDLKDRVADAEKYQYSGYNIQTRGGFVKLYKLTDEGGGENLKEE